MAILILFGKDDFIAVPSFWGPVTNEAKGLHPRVWDINLFSHGLWRLLLIIGTDLESPRETIRKCYFKVNWTVAGVIILLSPVIAVILVFSGVVAFARGPG